MLYFAEMAPPWRSSSMLLGSLILLGWSASTWSDSSINPSALNRFKRKIDPAIRDKADKVFTAATSTLHVLKVAIETVDKNKVADVLSAIGTFASVAPYAGAAIFSIINLILIFIPVKDPVKEALTEVSRKLDSLSNQFSNLAKDVEFYSYVSIYSKDEIHILGTWKKLQDLLERQDSKTKTEQQTMLFIKYYENSAVENSVDSLYLSMTIGDGCLTKNIHNLLKEKFKCDIKTVAKYSLHLISLLWKGMVIKQAYLKLAGFDSIDVEDEHRQMLNKVSEIQSQLMNFCLDNYMEYMQKDVQEIAKGISSDNHQGIAVNVQNYLNQKYSWYNWVVMVYKSEKEKKHISFSLKEVDVGPVTVAVSYTLKSSETDDINQENYVKSAAFQCLKNLVCEEKLENRLKNCITDTDTSPGVGHDLTKYAKVTTVTRSKKAVEVPEPMIRIDCKWHYKAHVPHTGKISLHYSRQLPVCDPNPCQHGGWCVKLLESNEFLCKCPEGFYGDTCGTQLSRNEMKQMLEDLPSPTTQKQTKEKVIIISRPYQC